MDAKPKITWSGDPTLFKALEPWLVTGLPRDPVEWRRSYGRAPKVINVVAEFLPFAGDKLVKDSRSMINHPFFHIFWIDCDLDAYKTTVKDEIAEWLSTLKKHNISDWMIISVVNDESKVKTKLLRTSVIDKVRSDFCSKSPDRCIVLTEPQRTDSKSSESWALVLCRIRQLLLQAYNKSLSKFEDGMRAERERRTQTGWSFNQYFLLQEELAFVFEMLGLYEDALVQYDELDALFTQFILNHAAGDIAEWLNTFSQPCTRWEGLSLSTSLDHGRRSLIQQNQATLLDLRDYLFSRQCALLLLMFRPWEVAQRAIPFMNNCMQELQILEVKMPEGAVACWSFVSSLEVMHTCERYSSGQVESYSLFTASLWEYAHKKLDDLGNLCGLMPGVDTSSHELQTVVTLLTGMERSKCDSQAMVKLREAMSSKQMFEKHYLEIAELAMGTFKYIGRIRSARLIGQAMAKFYMLLGKPNKAEPFLLDAVKTYHQERWTLLADHSWLLLAECQSMLNNTQRYLRSCTYIAASKVLPVEKRQLYCDEMMAIASRNEDSPVRVKLQPAFTVSCLSLATKGPFILGQDIQVDLDLVCSLPGNIQCEDVTLVVNTDYSGQRPKFRDRHSSVSSINSMDYAESLEHELDISQIDLQIKTQFSTDKQLSSVSFVCNNAHAVLRRAESGQAFMMDREIKKEESNNCFRLPDVTLSSGMNHLKLITKAESEGSFTSGQLCVSLGGLDFIQTRLPKGVNFDVNIVEPSIELKFNDNRDYLVAGISQEIEVILYTQSYEIPAGSVLSLSSPPGLDIKWADSQSSEIQLECNQPYQTLRLLAQVLAQVTELELQFVDYQITVMCSWCSCSFQPTVTVQQPFQVRHQLHTAGLRKFLQVVVKGISNSTFELTKPVLETSKAPDIDVVSLNKQDKTLCVSIDQTAVYLWQLVNNTPETPDLTCWFSIEYQEAGTGEARECTTDFSLSSYNTLYEVRCNVTPKSGEECCVGDLCLLEVEIDSLDINCTHDQLVYEVSPDRSSWAIASDEKRTGVVALTNGNGLISINMLPLVTGYLRLPAVNMFKCSSAKLECESSGGEHEEFSDGQIYNSTRGRNVHVLQKELLSVTI